MRIYMCLVAHGSGRDKKKFPKDDKIMRDRSQ